MSVEPPRCVHANGRVKRSYRSPAKARRAARLARGGRFDYLTGKTWSTYECPVCGLWHLTTTITRDPR